MFQKMGTLQDLLVRVKHDLERRGPTPTCHESANWVETKLTGVDWSQVRWWGADARALPNLVPPETGFIVVSMAWGNVHSATYALSSDGMVHTVQTWMPDWEGVRQWEMTLEDWWRWVDTCRNDTSRTMAEWALACGDAVFGLTTHRLDVSNDYRDAPRLVARVTRVHSNGDLEWLFGHGTPT